MIIRNDSAPWGESLLDEVAKAVPPIDAGNDVWVSYKNADTQQVEKYQSVLGKWGPAASDLVIKMHQQAVALGTTFGIPDLSLEMFGGGYHLIPPGQTLRKHIDFNRSKDTGKYRRLNLIIYLNGNWQDEGGNLVFGLGNDVQVIPEFGRTVVFETSDCSWHGVPVPSNRWRLSFAGYYFSDTPPSDYSGDHETVWVVE